MSNKPILISGIKPTNRLTLANYLGAIKNYLKLQNDYNSFFFIADYHMLTTPFEPKDVKKFSMGIARYYLACGINPKTAKIFRQSDVPSHLELSYLLMVHTSIGELSRMTQFKDKSDQIKLKNNTLTVPSGILFYPVLMAADILIYDAKLVPVGYDQKQHLELTRNIALRFNKKYNKNIFSIPNAYMGSTASRIKDLQNPEIKMSKSNSSSKGVIFLDDNLDLVRDKIMKAKTDSLNKINHDLKSQPGVSNLIEIYCSIKQVTIKDYLIMMKDKNYGNLKSSVAEAVCEVLNEIQKKYLTIDDQTVCHVLENGANYCRAKAQAKVDQVHKILGLKSNHYE